MLIGFASDKTITDYYIRVSGISISNEYNNKNSVHVALSAEEQEGIIDIYIDSGNGIYQESSVYVYRDMGKIFTSTFSIEDARFNGVQYKHEIGVISDKEYQDLHAVFSRRDIKEAITVYDKAEAIAKDTFKATASSKSDKTTYVEGHLYWTTENGDLRPLSNMRVDLFDYDPLNADDHLGTTYTDVLGYYSFSFQNDDSFIELYGCDVYIRVYPDGRTFEIGKNWNTTIFYYYCDSSTTNNVPTGSTTDISWDIYYNPDNNHNNAFYIAQGLVVAEAYAAYMLGYYPDEVVKVWFPLMPGDLTSFLNWINDTFSTDIEALGPPGAFCFGSRMGISGHFFNNWDTVMHEYGHYIEHQVDTYGPTFWEHMVFNPSHSFNDDAVDAHTFLWGATNITCKTYGLELAWSEAWASAFSLVAQDFYNNNILDISNVPGVYDVYDDGWNCENPYSSILGGEANEWAITCLLWDLYDSNSDVGDSITMGPYAWWSATTISGTYKLSDFVKKFETNYPQYRSQMGDLLARFKMAPTGISFSVSEQSLTSATTITVSWTKTGGRPSKPNNNFRISIYDSNGTQLLLSNSTSASSITVNISSLRSKLDVGTTHNLYFGVFGYETASPQSGPYISDCKSFTLINPLAVTSSTRYSEYTGSSLLGAWQQKYVSFATAGSKVVQTFGTKDTKMEIYNAAGNLIASNDDGGYSTNALISFTANANEAYKIRVRFYSILTIGSFKVGFISAPSIANYENITVITPSIPLITVTAPSYLSCLYAFKNTTTGTRTIYTASAGSSADSFIYVIDPRSTNLITSSDYDDDGGSGYYSSLTKTFDANVPYLIIASKYTLSTNQTYLLCNS